MTQDSKIKGKISFGDYLDTIVKADLETENPVAVSFRMAGDVGDLYRHYAELQKHYSNNAQAQCKMCVTLIHLLEDTMRLFAHTFNGETLDLEVIESRCCWYENEDPGVRHTEQIVAYDDVVKDVIRGLLNGLLSREDVVFLLIDLSRLTRSFGISLCDAAESRKAFELKYPDRFNRVILG